jgi:hypothetical protein
VKPALWWTCGWSLNAKMPKSWLIEGIGMSCVSWSHVSDIYI